MDPTITAEAVLSDCGTYRYELRRVWDPTKPLVVWVMLNPSTADASVDDPTIRKVVGFSKKWEAGGAVVINLFALRSTDPSGLLSHPEPTGDPRTADLMTHWLRAASAVVVGWGAHPLAVPRGRLLFETAERLRTPLTCLGTTKDGHPRHPLYVRYEQPRHRWIPKT